MHYALLPERGFIQLSGDDTVAFLQSLVSNDVTRVQSGEMIYAALLTPQGKFQHDFFLLPWQGGIVMDVVRARLPDMLQRLNMYKLRSKVTIAEKKELSVAAVWGEGSAPKVENVTTFADPRLPQLGWRMVGEATALRALPVKASSTDYDRMRLELGVPEGARDLIQGKSILLEFGFEDLHGVDFKKGCYVGQEVTARTKYRSTLRKFIYQLHADAPLPAPGAPVYADEAIMGELCSSLGNAGLALLRVAELEIAQKKAIKLRCGNAVVKVNLPRWITQAPKALTVEE